MFRLTQEQMAAFQQRATESFVDRMVVHLRTTLPRQTAPVADPDLRDLVRRAIVRAARHDLVTELDVCQYVERMIVFGPVFDSAGNEGSHG